MWHQPRDNKWRCYLAVYHFGGYSKHCVKLQSLIQSCVWLERTGSAQKPRIVLCCNGQCHLFSLSQIYHCEALLAECYIYRCHFAMLSIHHTMRHSTSVHKYLNQCCADCQRYMQAETESFCMWTRCSVKPSGHQKTVLRSDHLAIRRWCWGQIIWPS